MKLWRVPFPKFGAGSCLPRTAMVAERLGLDLGAFGQAGAVIVGSNGKGSTAAMTAALLSSRGPVGLFTSPHLLRLNERFRIGEEEITDADLAHHWGRVEQAIDASGVRAEFGGFEFLFLIAADWFAARACVHTVWEAGLGGRLDPVKLVRARTLALTSLDLEHTAILGDTLEAIAKEKLAAASPGARVFAPEFPAPLRGSVAGLAAQLDLEIAFTPPLTGAAVALPGAHQNSNAALARLLALALAPSLTTVEIARGFQRVRWPGRMEVLHRAPLVVIDVGHTPAAIEAGRAAFAALAGASAPQILICGASRDKAAEAMIAPLAAGFDCVICAAASHKGVPAAEIAIIVAKANPSAELIISSGVAEARLVALAKAGGTGAIFVAGGLFLAAEYRAAHHGVDPAALAFF